MVGGGDLGEMGRGGSRQVDSLVPGHGLDAEEAESRARQVLGLDPQVDADAVSQVRGHPQGEASVLALHGKRLSSTRADTLTKQFTEIAPDIKIRVSKCRR